MYKRLYPKTIIVYGSAPDDIFQTCTGNPDRCVRPFRKMIPCIDAHEPR